MTDKRNTKIANDPIVITPKLDGADMITTDGLLAIAGMTNRNEDREPHILVVGTDVRLTKAVIGRNITSDGDGGTTFNTAPRAAFEEIGSWCIWTKRGRRPQFFHPARDLAMAEAERLAQLHPGQKFIVMKMEGKFGVPADEPGIEDTTE